MSTETTAEDDFGKFFDNLGDLAANKKPVPSDFGATDVTVAATPAAVAVEPAVADAGATDPVVVADPDAVSTDPVVAPVVVPATPAASVRSDEAGILERLADVLDRRAPPPAPARGQPQPAPRLYTDEEIATLQAAEKDYPDLMKAFQLAMRGTTVQNNAYIMRQVNDYVAPAIENMQTVQQDHHMDTLHRAVPDYDAVYDPVTKWVATDRSIPAPLRAAYKGVIDTGEVGDVKWLVDEWRKATGTSVSPTQTPVAKPTGHELSEAAKQAARSLAPVVSRATAVVTSADPVTFDDAWDKFANTK
jgi:hypothetical protein